MGYCKEDHPDLEEIINKLNKKCEINNNKLDLLVREIYKIIDTYYDEKESKKIKELIIDFARSF